MLWLTAVLVLSDFSEGTRCAMFHDVLLFYKKLETHLVKCLEYTPLLSRLQKAVKAANWCCY